MSSVAAVAAASEVATFLENWPHGLVALSLPQEDVPLSLDEAAALGRAMSRYGHRFPRIAGAAGLLEALMLRLDRAVRRFPDGAFVRLGSRSPKDSAFVQELRGRIFGGRLALMCLTEGSVRIADDLEWALAHRYPPHVFVRPWTNIPPWAELRGFMRGRRLVGISQYNSVAQGRSFSELRAQAVRAQNAVRAFFPRFEAACHLADCVFDVVLWHAEAPAALAVLLLEIGPFGSDTDTLLFGPSDEDFDGSFRFLAAPSQPVRLM
jgi:hypothetical protein